MNHRRLFMISFFLSTGSYLWAQKTLSLEECLANAKQNNTAVNIAKQSVETKQELQKLSQKNMLPKVDLLAGYNHLGKPIEINLQQVKNGIVEGTANQSLSSANTIYQQITGNQLPQNIQQIIYQTSKDIINALYPNYNPALAKQDYFLAGLFVRQPIYLGGKLKAVQNLSNQQTETSKVNLENAQDLISYNIILQYIQIQYLNSMLAKQQQIVNSLEKNNQYAGNLLKSEIIPPYQKKWAEAALIQGKTSLDNLSLEKQNALLTIKQLSGINLDENVDIPNILPEEMGFVDNATHNLDQNTDLRILNSKKEEANIGLKVAKAGNYPNIFAIGNLQFLRKDLPVITPPWLVGIEMQWTLFDGFETKNKIKVAESLRTEADMLVKQKTETLDLAYRIAKNKIEAFENQSRSLDNARQESYTTTDMIKKRMENSLSSVKDVNDALQMQYELEKAYYTSLLGYQVAVATYYYISGNTEKTLNAIK